MNTKSNKLGQNYTPTGITKKNCNKNKQEFIVGACRLDHGHIYGMCKGLKEFGAKIKYVFDYDKSKVNDFLKTFPDAIVISTVEEMMKIKEINLIATSAIANERYLIGLKALDNGKDFFSDKAPFTTLEQVSLARKKVKETGKKWFVYYSERLHVESAIFAGDLIKSGRIGNVVSIKGWGPHRLAEKTRPNWFFNKEQYGGILTDIGSHQLEQVLSYANAKDAKLLSSRVGNLTHPQYPGLEDFGDATYITDNNIPCYISVDWFTPDGLTTWGDGRMFIVGTKGYIEIRKYVDIANSTKPNHIYVVDEEKEEHYEINGMVGFPFFGELIQDCLNRTEIAMTQEHIFRSIELAIEAENKAIIIK